MKREFTAVVFLALFLAAAPAAAQQPVPAGGQPLPPRLKQLDIRPAAAPVPALKYQLLPEFKDQTSGNAALLYYRSFSSEYQSYKKHPPGFFEKMDKLRKAPLKELANNNLNELPAPLLRELDQAARREHCDWDLLARLRKEGAGTYLPEIQEFRNYVNLLDLRARQELAKGNYEKAAYTLQTGFAMSRHVSEAPTLISGLVGVGLSGVMLFQVEEMIQAPGSPNLYWALTNLPRPFMDMRKALQVEKDFMFAGTHLQGIETAKLDQKQQEELAEQLCTLLSGDLQEFRKNGKKKLIAWAEKSYPEAKRFLVGQGRKAEEVDALPKLQVVAIYSVHQYRRLYDDLSKWFNFPYWQASPELERIEKQVLAEENDFTYFASLMVPSSVRKVYFASVRLDRHVAALRCIEAVRLHAAAHDGRLPEKLSEVKEVPIPIDPVTGKDFEYSSDGDTGILYAPPPPGQEAQAHGINMLRYELIRKR